jgi:hypothetical protein
VCKTFRSIAFEVEKKLHFIDGPLEIVQSVLSRDLRHLRKLFFSSTEKDDTDWIVARLDILSTLHKLNDIILRFEYTSQNQQDWTHKFSPICDSLQKMTWLESLEIQYPIIENLVAFANHSKLTKLVLASVKNGGKNCNNNS